MMDCEMPPMGRNFFNSVPNGYFRYAHKDVHGNDTSSLYTSDGCPVAVLPLNLAIFGHQVKELYKKHKSPDGSGPGWVSGSLDIMKFEDFKMDGPPIACYPAPSPTYDACMKRHPRQRMNGCPGQNLRCDQTERSNRSRWDQCVSGKTISFCRVRNAPSISKCKQAAENECKKILDAAAVAAAPPPPPPSPYSTCVSQMRDSCMKTGYTRFSRPNATECSNKAQRECRKLHPT